MSTLNELDMDFYAKIISQLEERLPKGYQISLRDVRAIASDAWAFIHDQNGKFLCKYYIRFDFGGTIIDVNPPLPIRET